MSTPKKNEKLCYEPTYIEFSPFWNPVENIYEITKTYLYTNILINPKPQPQFTSSSIIWEIFFDLYIFYLNAPPHLKWHFLSTGKTKPKWHFLSTGKIKWKFNFLHTLFFFYPFLTPHLYVTFTLLLVYINLLPDLYIYPYHCSYLYHCIFFIFFFTFSFTLTLTFIVVFSPVFYWSLSLP